MVKLNKIYTRGGDGGESSLVDGTRLPKDASVFEAIGTVDEANAAIGIARLSGGEKTTAILEHIQNDMFDLGADLATPIDGTKSDGALRITETQVSRLENEIDEVSEKLDDLTSFVLPGGSQCASALHVARTTTRRAERAMVSMSKETKINPQGLRYINRLSDLLFQLSRLENNGGKDDILWKPGGEIS